MKRRNKLWILFFAAVLALGLGAFAALAQGGAGEYRSITPEEAAQRLGEGKDALIVDVRTQEEYDEKHIPGAVLVPLDTIKTEPVEALANLDQELYVHCRTGVRSRQAVEKLAALGYTNVYDLGGIVDWPYETISTEDEQKAAQEAQDEAAAAAQLRSKFLSSFTATDLEGNPVDQSLFAGHRLTMINVWATYCQPCLSEMPELGKLHQDYQEKGVQIVGLVSDATKRDGSISQSQVDFAKEIVEKTGAGYTHMLPSKDLTDILLWQVSAVPTTIFVDENGGLVGYAYMGSASYETWAGRIEEALKELEEAEGKAER